MKRKLINRWESNNLPLFFYYVSLGVLLTMALLIGFDFAWFGADFSHYLPHRLAMTLFFTAMTYLFSTFKVHERPFAYAATSWTLIVAAIGSTAWYQYFLLSSPKEHYQTILYGNMLNVFTICLFSSIFPLWNIIYTAYAIGSYVMLSFVLGSDAHLITVAAVIASVIAWTQRHLFKQKLYSDYKNRLVSFDERSAFDITVRRYNQTLEKMFPPRKSAVAIIVIDIRDSQHLFESNEIESQLKINTFFTLVYKCVNDMAKDARKIIKTHGDEINIILYSHDIDDLEALSLRSVLIAQKLSLEVFVAARTLCSPSLLYDIGVSWGINLVGLMGAENLKTPDVYGDVIVQAKRFESMARNMRRDEDYPIVITKSGSQTIPFRTGLIRSEKQPSLVNKISDPKVIVYRRSG